MNAKGLKSYLSYYYAVNHSNIKLGTPYSLAEINQPPVTFLSASELQMYEYTFQFIKTLLVQVGGSRFLVQVNIDTIPLLREDLEFYSPRKISNKHLQLKPCKELLLERNCSKVKHLV
jgi:hypothetical protein